MTPHEDEQASLDDELLSAIDTQEAEIEASTETAEIEVTEEVAEEESTVEITEEEVQESEPLQAPPRWSKAARDAFNSWAGVPGGEAYQQAMLEQYGETQTFATQKAQEASTFKKQAEDWNAIFEPFQQQMNLQGTDGPRFMRQLLGYYQQLNANPAATIQQLAQSYNLDLANIGQDQPYRSPTEVALEQRIEQLSRAFQGNQEHARQRELDRVNQQIESFANELDESGNLLHPHFQQVQESMTRLIQGGLSEDLPSAYEKACMLDSNIQTQAQAEAQRKSVARKAANANKARLAAKRPQGKHTGEAVQVQKLDDELLQHIKNQAA